MEVSIPLIQNQVIDHTGTYRIVQRTVNGQTGLVIEEYIPEPEPEEEVLQNNSNTRAMIIDEDENNNENNENNNNDNNGQMVLRGQNNVRGLPDSTGTAIEGTFEINIPQTISPKINIKYFSIYENGTSYEIKNLNIGSGTLNVEIPVSSVLVTFEKSSSYYYIKMYTNRTDSAFSVSVNSSTRYYLDTSDSVLNSLYLKDENRNRILYFYDQNSNDNRGEILRLYRDVFYLIFD